MVPTRDPQEELLEIADQLASLLERSTAPEVREPLKRLEEAANRVGKAWSGSFLGYHARIYYKDLNLPPPGAHFSPEWGMQDSWPIVATQGDWVEYDPDEVEEKIRELAGKSDLEPTRQLAETADSAFQSGKPDLLSILTTALAEREDGFIASLREQVEHTRVLSKDQILREWLSSGRLASRDSLAVMQGRQAPPHLLVLSEVMALKQAQAACDRLGQLARKAGSHLARQQRRSRRTREIGTNVFIGHGRSPIWRELKDFVQDRLHLPWDEFNRVPIAGVTNVARLSEMLDAAAIAFLILTGEDEQPDGRRHARLNVVHEAGLFQGRLGFTKAVVLLEEGCEEFSNIQGLGQLRFPRGNIRAVFDEIRQVLEREGIVAGDV